MCNPTDNLVQYPLPYKVVDGCLCQETTKRNKPTTEKLCNFTAYIVNEVLFDDGVGTSRTMRIGGVHASGRKLPEIEVTASEFKKMDCLTDMSTTATAITATEKSIARLTELTKRCLTS